MQTTESRLELSPGYPPIVYLETAMIFFGANFLFHQNVFRRSANRAHFAGFMLVNLCTSFHIAESFNLQAARYYAAAYNNTVEVVHRADMHEKLRKQLFKPAPKTLQ